MFQTISVENRMDTIKKVEDLKLKTNMIPYKDVRLNLSSLPRQPGIIMFFEDEELVYICETDNMNGIFRIMPDTCRHELRRNVGEVNFSRKKYYSKADSKKKFHGVIETSLNEWFDDKFSCLVISIDFGRKEIEEYFIKEYKPRYNKKVQKILGT